MIKSIRHRGLKRLFGRGDSRGISANQLDRIEDVLGHLDVADKPASLDLPGYSLHPLNGNRKGSWSVRVSGNWRIVFTIESGDVFDVDPIDYH